MALSGPAGEVVQKLKATMDCGFALLMWAVGVRSSGPDTYAVKLGAGQGDVTDVTTTCML